MLPTVAGVIARRMLVNFRVDPEIASALLPKGVQLKLHKGYGIAGICLIRLERMHPASIPLAIGLSSENAAHRIAVTFDGQDGVYIPRRDTNSRLSSLLGSRLVPGVHHLASFHIEDRDGRINYSMDSADGVASVKLVGTEALQLPTTSIFETIEESSSFFESGSTGISDRSGEDGYDQIELEVNRWEVHPFDVERMQSSFFDDETRFPEGSVEFDHALIMRNIPHAWRSKPRFSP